MHMFGLLSGLCENAGWLSIDGCVIRRSVGTVSYLGNLDCVYRVCGKALSWLARIFRLTQRPWPLTEDGRRVGSIQWIGLMLGPCKNAGLISSDGCVIGNGIGSTAYLGNFDCVFLVACVWRTSAAYNPVILFLGKFAPRILVKLWSACSSKVGIKKRRYSVGAG